MLKTKFEEKFKEELADVKKATLIFRAINNPMRMQIFSLLANKEICVSDLYRKMDIEQSVASQHLGILRRAGFVKIRRDRRFIYYTANLDRLESIKKISRTLVSKNGKEKK